MGQFKQGIRSFSPKTREWKLRRRTKRDLVNGRTQFSIFCCCLLNVDASLLRSIVFSFMSRVVPCHIDNSSRRPIAVLTPRVVQARCARARGLETRQTLDCLLGEPLAPMFAHLSITLGPSYYGDILVVISLFSQSACASSANHCSIVARSSEHKYRPRLGEAKSSTSLRLSFEEQSVVFGNGK